MRKFIECDGRTIEPLGKAAGLCGKAILVDAAGVEWQGVPAVVIDEAPWVEVALEVEGGYLAFDSRLEYETAISQR